jgi:predicted NAD-dependent protein-ADP-ribosyltransferase YbiA (DUF1768 family)
MYGPMMSAHALISEGPLMKVRLKPGLLIVTAESPEERDALAAWSQPLDGHVFALRLQDAQTVRLTDLGSRADACREPINVTSRSADPAIQLISNFAHTPFELDGLPYASVEAFWQGLKFPDEPRRRQIASLYGDDARRAGFDAPDSATTEYRGRIVRVGTADHWRLMTFACWAKFNQHDAARQALLASADRPLVHKTRRDSRNIPGVVMADIWMKVRCGLVNRIESEVQLDAPDHDDAPEQQEQSSPT